jgi:hypothetical protein
VVEPVVDLSPECVNPGDQGFEVSDVDFLLKQNDLIPQILKILGRTRLV